MNKRIWLSLPQMGGSEIRYIEEAFRSNWIAPLGPNVDAFERSIASFCGVSDATALSSGTAAIHLALILLGVRAGDEVISSSFTFAASVNPIVYQGAVPVLVDSEPETWNMSPTLLEDAIKDRLSKGKKPKAIILVHLYGMPSQMDSLLEIAQFYQIPLIEDAAEALGSKYKERPLGSFGDLSVLSFNGNKIISTSGGGALLANNSEIISRARFLATQARDQAPHYQHSEIGYNYRMSNVLAGIGRGQMEVLEQRVVERRKNFQYYFDHLQDLSGVVFQTEPSEAFFSNRWLTTLLIDPQKSGSSRVKIQAALEKENIESRPLWKPMHLQPVFSKLPSYLNGCSEKFFQQGLCLPSGSNLTQSDLRRISNVLIGYLKKK